MHEKAVHLGLGQGVGALLFDGVLGGQHHEKIREPVGRAGYRDLPLLHGFQQGGLNLCRRTIDFVGQDQVAEDGARLKAELPLSPFRVVHFRAGHVRWEQVRGELDTSEIGLEEFGQRFDRAGLGKTGQPLHEQIAVGKQADEQTLDDVFLADDRPGDSLLKLCYLLATVHF